MYVELTKVGHSFDGDHWLFRSLNTRIVAGNMYAVVGPSGSGKSTLLSILAGWLQPSLGTVKKELGGSTSWVFQNPHGVSRRRVIDHVSLPLIARGISRREADGKAMRLLEEFGLEHRHRQAFSTLSGGEAQRLMLARGVASQPSLLLVDEPTAQLDRDMAATVNSHLRALVSSNTIVVIATHDADTQAACTHTVDLGGHRL